MSLIEPLQQLLVNLPLHAEEGRQRESIEEVLLTSRIDAARGEILVAMIRRVFESLQLLDRQALMEGRWTFVSFPAFLLARSLVATWACADQTLVENGYWENDGSNEEIIEQQRTLLHVLESRRQQHHPNACAVPIRFVHVAWGVIRLGSAFVMHKREDLERSDAKRYVLPGGRLQISDFPKEFQSAKFLRELEADTSELVEQSLERTLKRELQEEFALAYGYDYTAQLWKALRPYDAVEGGGNKHALTRYRITLFSISLTASGEIKVFKKTNSDQSKFPLFSLEDLANEKRPDGSTAYIDAVREDLGTGTKFIDQFDKIPDSLACGYSFSSESQGVQLPESALRPILVGKTGHEKVWHVPLTEWGIELLHLLVWCGRGFPVDADSSRVLVLGGGWVQLLRKEEATEVKAMANRLAAEGLPLIEFSGEAFRLAVSPEHTYLHPACFSYGYKPVGKREGGGTIELLLNSRSTTFGRLAGRRHSIPIPPQIAAVVEAVRESRAPNAIFQIREARDLSKHVRDSVTSHARRLGLRLLMKLHGNEADNDWRILIAETQI